MPPSFVPSERRAPSDRGRELERRRMFANELAEDVMEREREKSVERGERSESNKTAEAARKRELAARFYDELARAEQERKRLAPGSHRDGFRVGVSESVERLSNAIGERFKALSDYRRKSKEG